MTKPFHLPLGSRSYLRAAMRTAALIVGSLSSFAAYAQTYPVSGVWVAMDHQFPHDGDDFLRRPAICGARRSSGGASNQIC